MIEDLIATLFLSREVAHRAHLTVTGPGSFSKHMALGSFYVEIGENADSIAEAYMGRHGVLGEIPMMGYKPEKDIADCLQSQLDSVEKMRYKCCPKEDTAIQNLIDESVATYLSTLYKLRNLK